jgi:hypothetical protein
MEFRQPQETGATHTSSLTRFRTARHLSATRVANELCANMMRGVGGVALKASAHWSVSHSLISHHRTATIKQSTGFVGSLWSAFVPCGGTIRLSHITLRLLVIFPSNYLTSGAQNCMKYEHKSVVGYIE